MAQAQNKAIIANPLRAIRHADGFHARLVAPKAGKGSFRRREKHQGRNTW